MIKEIVLRDFPNWTPEKQLSEYQGYKAMGEYSPFSDADYTLMEMVMNNPNAEIEVVCEDGVCQLVKDLISENEAIESEELNESEFKEIIELLIFEEILNENEDNIGQESINKLKVFIETLFLEPKFKQTIMAGKSQYIKIFASIFKKLRSNPSYRKNFTTFLTKISYRGFKSVVPKTVTSDEWRDLVDVEKFDFSLDKMITLRHPLKDAYWIIDLILTSSLTAGLKVEYIKSLKQLISLDPDEKKDNNVISSNTKEDEHVEKDFDSTYKEDDSEILTMLKDMANSHDELVNPITNNSEAISLDQSYEDYFINAMKKKNASLGNEGDEEFKIESFVSSVMEEHPEWAAKAEVENMTATDFLSSDKVNDLILEKRINLMSKVSSKFTTEQIKEVHDWIENSFSKNDLQKPSPAKISDILNTIYSTSPNKELIHSLLVHGDTAEGRGEKLIEFVFHYAISGGGESFDIKIGVQKYEVKTYIEMGEGDNKKLSGSIRLGQEGNLFKSDKFTRFFIFMTDLSYVFKDGNEDVVKSMLGETISSETFDQISNILDSNIIEQLKKGEFSASNIIKANKILNLLKLSFMKMKDNEFFYMKVYIKNKNMNFVISKASPDPRKKDISNEAEVKFVASIQVSDDTDREIKAALMRILGNTDLIHSDGYISEMAVEAMEEINNAFETKHPMILLNDLKGANKTKPGKDNGVKVDAYPGANKTKACLGVFNKFKMGDITQRGFKVYPVDYNN